MSENLCVCCGASIPEGRQVCQKCERVLTERRTKSDAGTHMTEEDYRQLFADGSEIDEDTAILLINKEWGFEASRVDIGYVAEAFGRNNGRIELQSHYNRVPCYAASDWNYVRFDAAGLQYEMVNGELYFYED